MLLAEFDPVKDAVINPDMVIKAVPDFPETGQQGNDRPACLCACLADSAKRNNMKTTCACSMD